MSLIQCERSTATMCPEGAPTREIQVPFPSPATPGAHADADADARQKPTRSLPKPHEPTLFPPPNPDTLFDILHYGVVFHLCTNHQRTRTITPVSLTLEPNFLALSTTLTPSLVRIDKVIGPLQHVLLVSLEAGDATDNRHCLQSRTQF